MGAAPDRALNVETEWLRGFAQLYEGETALAYSPEDLRRSGVDLIGVQNLFRTGTVVFSDKLDTPGARWVVKGADDDGNDLLAEIEVISESLSVKVIKIERSNLWNGDGHDAA